MTKEQAIQDLKARIEADTRNMFAALENNRRDQAHILVDEIITNRQELRELVG